MRAASAPPVPPARAFAARRPLLLGGVTLMVLCGGLFGWGALATIAGAVIATGRVEVETRDQVVEHVDGGTVGAVLVRDGDRVAAGDVLVRLDDTEPRFEAAILKAELAELVARRNRLEAEFRDAAAPVWDGELADWADGDAAVREILDGQRRLFEARRSARAGQVAQLRERIGQTGKQIEGLTAQADAVRRQSGFIARELDGQRRLFEQGLTELPRLLELEREAARLDGQAGDLTARIAGARGRIAEIEIQILRLGTERVEQTGAEAREVQAQENQVRERLARVRGRLRHTEVRAPVAGEVVGMRVFATGEVVRPGEPILKIVPADTDLVVRAQLEPIHVDQVWAGAGGGAAVLGVPGAHHARVRGPGDAGVGGCRAGRAHRARLVRDRGPAGPGRRAGGGDRDRGVGGIRGRDGDGMAAGVARGGDAGHGRRCGGAGAGARPDARAGHAGRGASAHRRALPAQLSRQAAHRLLLAVVARGIRCAARRARPRHAGGQRAATPAPAPGAERVRQGGGRRCRRRRSSPRAAGSPPGVGRGVGGDGAAGVSVVLRVETVADRGHPPSPEIGDRDGAPAFAGAGHGGGRQLEDGALAGRAGTHLEAPAFLGEPAPGQVRGPDRAAAVDGHPAVRAARREVVRAAPGTRCAGRRRAPG